MAEDSDALSGPFGTYQYPNLADVSIEETRRVFALHFAYMTSPGQPAPADLLARAAAIDAWLAAGAAPETPARKLAAVKG